MSLARQEAITPTPDLATLPFEHAQRSGDDILRAASFLCHTNGSDTQSFERFLTGFGDTLSPDDLFVYSRVVPAIVQHPTTPAEGIRAFIDVDKKQLSRVHKWIQSSEMLRMVVTSHYYPGYLMVRYAQSFLKDLVENSQYLKDVVDRKPVAPKRLEVHATNASCNYRCVMCLWHGQGKGKYAYSPERQLLSVGNWNEVLDQAKEMGTEVIIFSGGGEPLLRSNAGEVIDHANKIGLSTMIYVNGSQLESLPEDSQLYQAILDSDWLRVSLHATTDERYASLVQLPKEVKPLSRVIRGIERLKRDRDRLGKPLKIGLGFVAQHDNFDQVYQVAELAKKLGMDLLNIREDCIDITQHLSAGEKKLLYQQLRNIRTGIETGTYGDMDVDFADSMIAPMNGWSRTPHVETSNDCKVHLYRSAIDPFGRVAVCDLVSEPFFATDNLTLGFISPETDYRMVLGQAAEKQFDARLCTQCMPGQKAINALWFKVLEDARHGINPKDQPLLFDRNQTIGIRHD